MTHFNPDIHHRRSIRLKGYDYAQAGLYFITLLVQNRANIFGEVVNGEMKLSYMGKIAEEEWLKTLEIRDNIALAEYIVMPNHIHGIIEIKYAKKQTEEIGVFKSPSQTIGAIIRGYKGASTKRIKEHLRDISTTDGGTGVSWKGELQFAPAEEKPTDDKGETPYAPAGKGVSLYAPAEKPTDDKGESWKGELQFAPTPSPAEIKKLDLSKSIWQRDYYDIIIRDEKAYQNISNYIINNPKKWEEDKFFKKHRL